MDTSESYRTSVLPDLSGRGATAARALLVAGPVALLGAQLAASLQSASGAEAVLSRAAVPLMLAWAAVLFLLTRTTARLAAWTGLVAITMQVSLVQEVTDGPLLFLVEGLGFVAFAVALWRLSWVPRVVPVLLVGFPVVDSLTPSHGNLLATVAFASVVAVGLLLARGLGGVTPDRVVEDEPAWVGRTSPRLTARTAGPHSGTPLSVRMLPPIG